MIIDIRALDKETRIIQILIISELLIRLQTTSHGFGVRHGLKPKVDIRPDQLKSVK